MEILLRVMVGGVVVSGFALLGDLLKPKRCAGLFGAAPSVALATLVLTVVLHARLLLRSRASGHQKPRPKNIRRPVGLFALCATLASRLYHRSSPSVGRALAQSRCYLKA